MGEGDVVARTDHGPVTQQSLTTDLNNLGVMPGVCLLVHSSLSALGWVCGGAPAVILAIEEVVRPFGIVVMPAHSGDLSDPSGWVHPPVPETWWDTIRHTMPAFDPDLTPAKGVGVIAESFRKQLDVVRSSHPQVSFAAWGEDCIDIVQNHSLEFGLGDKSPIARIYDHDGSVLLLGVDHGSNTSLHLAESKAKYRHKEVVRCSSPILVDGHRRWKQYDDWNYDETDFVELGHDFLRDNQKDVKVGKVGYAKCQLFSQRLCVDYAVKWIERKRR